jgi:hypothetical protein
VQNVPTPETREALTCAGCSTQSNVLEPPELFGEVLCPECVRTRALWKGAENHLRVILKAPLLTWFKHWQAAGVDTSSLQDILEESLRKVCEDTAATPETGA